MKFTLLMLIYYFIDTNTKLPLSSNVTVVGFGGVGVFVLFGLSLISGLAIKERLQLSEFQLTKFVQGVG